MAEFFIHFLLGSMIMTLLWSALSLTSVKLVRLYSPVGRFLVFLAPLVAAFVARARLSPDKMSEIVTFCFAVAILLLCRDVYRYFMFLKRIKFVAEPSADLQRVVDGLSQFFGIPSPRAQVSNDSGISPLTAGIRNPFLVVPRSMLPLLTEDEVRLLVAHELAHIRRKDALWKWPLLFLRRLSFLNPAASWPYQLLNLEMERGADKLAVAITGKPGALARALLKVEEFLSRMSPSADTNIPETISRAGSYLPVRIQALSSLHDSTSLWANLAKLGLIFSVFRLICFHPVELWLKLFQ